MLHPRPTRHLALAALILAGACAPADFVPTEDEILWDTWGVPHIYGTTEEALFRGQGWAQMASHGDLILRLYGQARGRAAEYWGADYLDSDRWVRTMGIPQRGAEWLAGESEEMRRNIEAFAQGMNAYAEAHPDRIADDVEVVLPVTGADVLAHGNRAIHFTFITNQGVVRQAQAVLERRVALGPLLQALDPQQRASDIGSNTWAIGPSRSESGNAILVANPHLPWGDLFLFWESHLVGPGIDSYGTTLVGVPGIAIGFNDNLGWSHTVNTYDGADLFAVEVDGDGYRFGDDTRPFETREETLRVKEEDGSMREETLTVRSSVHGPVVAMDGDRAVALRVAGLEKAGVSGQWWDMAKARDLAEFEAALSRLQIPMFNVMYADVEGHILYVFNGSVPERSEGDFRAWQGVMDGSDPTTLWTTYHSYDELPRILDPEIGWLQNANDPPWTATVPQVLDPADFPAYMSPTGMAFRPQRSANMLRADESITFEEAVAYKHSTVVEMAERIVPELVEAADFSENAAAFEAAEVLDRWDRTVDADARGALLFEAWATKWLRAGAPWVLAWDPDAPADTPDGLGDEELAVRLLVEAAEEVRETYGALDVAWGEVSRARVGDAEVPVSGGPGGMGVFRVANFSPLRDGVRQVTQGDSYYAVMEFGEDGVRARVLTAYGNATQGQSAHVGDQLRLYGAQEMRPVWRSREDVEANLEERVGLGG